MAKENIMENRTKIVCTIGPASSSIGVLKDMVKAGMDVARLNFSHGDHDSNAELIEKVREASKSVGRPVAILLDLQGPKIRVGELPGEGLTLKEGSIVKLQAGVAVADRGVIPVPYDRLAHDLKRGDRILIADGTRELQVLDISGQMISAKVLLGGTLISYKGINVPSVALSIESMTEKDKEDLQFGLRYDLDFVALSFVRAAEDVKKLRAFIAKHISEDTLPPHIVVKIEKYEALKNFDEILEETDAVMIARGDLGLETPVTQVPLRQKELIAKCLIAGKPAIVATEMLASMEHNPRPTRAEVSDVANAVIDHTDAVMLSGESAMGRYPVKAVQVMADIIEQTEESPLDSLMPKPGITQETVPAALGAAAVELGRRISADAILVTTESGYSARMAARLRPEIPLFAATASPRTYKQLILSWGVTAIQAEGYGEPYQMVEEARKVMKKVYGIKSGSKVVVMSGLKREGKGGFDTALRVVEI
ncbi:MAG: pyruvate kinase [Candidatus Andersenbacteria bacterium]|nr:pyruvate kinase [Candidatus Andersenbacteria bacterium]MBI3251263.1 pyruvate kinase [Candidatus Andersenbacteria bacterium]